MKKNCEEWDLKVYPALNKASILRENETSICLKLNGKIVYYLEYDPGNLRKYAMYYYFYDELETIFKSIKFKTFMIFVAKIKKNGILSRNDQNVNLLFEIIAGIVSIYRLKDELMSEEDLEIIQLRRFVLKSIVDDNEFNYDNSSIHSSISNVNLLFEKVHIMHKSYYLFEIEEYNILKRFVKELSNETETINRKAAKYFKFETDSLSEQVLNFYYVLQFFN